MFSVHTALEEFKNATVIGHFEGSRSEKSNGYLGVIVSKRSVYKMLFGHTRTIGSVFVTD